MGKSDSQLYHCFVLKVTHCSTSLGCIFMTENKIFGGVNVLADAGR